MKKAIFSAVVLSFLMVSCKKDWTCSCQTQIKEYNASGTVLTDNIYKQDVTIKKATRRTAYNHCSHRYWETTDQTGAKETTDDNCSLK